MNIFVGQQKNDQLLAAHTYANVESKSLVINVPNDPYNLVHFGASEIVTFKEKVEDEEARESEKSKQTSPCDSPSDMSHLLSSPSNAQTISTSQASNNNLSSSHEYPDDLNPFGDEEENEEEAVNETDHSVSESMNGSLNTSKLIGDNSTDCSKINGGVKLPVKEHTPSSRSNNSSSVSCNISGRSDAMNVLPDESFTRGSMISHTSPSNNSLDSTPKSIAGKMSTPIPKPRSLRGTGSIVTANKSSDSTTPLPLIPDEGHPSMTSYRSDRSETDSMNKSTKSLYPDDLNPFGSEGEAGEEEEESPRHVNKSAKKPGDSSLNPFDEEDDNNDEYDELLNPFSDSHDDKSDKVPPPISSGKSTPYELRGKVFTCRKKASSPQEAPSMNPVPKPRTSLFVSANSSHRQSSPCALRRETKSTGHLTPSRNSYRVSRPHLPPPPAPADLAKCLDDVHISPDSPSSGRRRKPPAPKPPSPLNVASMSSLASSLANSSANLDANSLHSVGSNCSPTSSPRRLSSANASANNESDAATATSSIPIKVPRKKRQAPAPPKAIRRTVIDSIESIQANLNEIGDELANVANQFKPLEEYFANNPAAESPDVDNKIYKYLQLARETCTLARRQEELMYARREHKLEQEHADLEYEIRQIELVPAFKRTAEQESKSQELLTRLIEVIDQRNEVVEAMTKINKRYVFTSITTIFICVR